MFILLAMVVLIGSFSIVTTLVMLVMEKTHDIAILMSMGATKGMIRRIFMLQGTIIGVVGTLLGYVLGIGWRSSSNDTNSSNFHRGFIRWITCPSCSIGLISSWSACPP